MARTIQSFKSFDDALVDEKRKALARTPQDRIMLLHDLIKAWMKFPRQQFRRRQHSYAQNNKK